MAETNKVEVVISGIAGIFPESDNVEELKSLLFSKQNGITSDSRRWILGEYGVTSGVGKIKSIDRFDNVFFNMHGKLCECSETVIKLNLERSVEAIIDAGINPGDLNNTNTAVFTCSSGSETDTIAMFDEAKSGFAIVGHNKAMQANRLSFSLNLNGPSFTVFSSFTGGVDALVMAKKLIENGHIRTAIIGGCNLVQRPNLSLHLKGLGVLTDGIETRSFSDDANGFNRSESCVAIILQNSLDAKRSYGTLLNAKMEQYGELDGIFTSYSSNHFKELIMEAYKETGIDPADVAYIEADGNAIKSVDAMELDIIKEVFCPPHRKKPLKMGSIKSNLGHTDASSGLVSIVKAIIAMDTGYIPPNINFNKPNSGSNAISSGKVEVVTEKTSLDGDIVGLNIFGRTGNYGHVILKKHKKIKTKIYKKHEMFDDGLPRLIFISGRSENAVRKTIQMIENYDVDEEYVALLHNVFSKNISAHFSRSCFIIPSKDQSREKDVYSITNEKPPVWFIFSGMGSQWLGMGEQLLRIPIFAKAIKKCDAILKPMGIDIIHIITSLDSNLFDNLINSFVGISAIQIGLVDILRALDIEPEGMIGHSVGELGCAYADGCFTAEEMILAAYARGRASVETELPDGMMAAIGLSYSSIIDRLPHDIDVACHNSSESCTLSGPTKSVKTFVEKLKSEDVFAKAVNVSNISFHSRYIKPAAPTLLKYLNKIILNPKQRSSRWLSSSIPESEWGSDLARYCSAEYHTNNLLNPVLFEEACVHIPKNAVVIEIAPYGLLQAILKKSLSDMINIPLTQRVFGNSVNHLLKAIGKMYCSGLNPNIEMLYNPVSFPVSAGTPPLHTLCEWNHEEKWSIVDVGVLMNKNTGERLISLSPSKNNSIVDYEINDCHVLPLSALLFYVWESYMELINGNEIKLPVIFQNLHYFQHVVINKIQPSDILTSIQSGTGCFEVCYNNKIVLSGSIFTLDHLNFNNNVVVNKKNNSVVSLNHEEVYSSLDQFGYSVGDVFKTIKYINIFENEFQSEVLWDNNWIHYLEALMQMPTLYNTEKRGELVFPISIQEIRIDPTVMKNLDSKDISVQYNIFTNEIISASVQISFSHFGILPLDLLPKTTFQLTEQVLVNLGNPSCNKPIDFINMCMNIILEYRHQDDLVDVFIFPVYNSKEYVLNNYVDYILKTKGHDVKLLNDMKIDVLNQYSDNTQYIVLTQNENLSHVTSLVKNKSRVHLIVSSNSPLTLGDDYTVVLQQKFEENSLYLIKKILKNNCDFTIHKLTKKSINCSNELKNVIMNLKALEKTIYVISKFHPTEGILPLVKTMNEIKNIRFFFILDNSAPEFNVNNQFYSKQLAKDLLVNVYKKGEWVTYKEIEFVNSIDFLRPLKKTNFANLTNTSLQNISVEYIGLNLQNTTVEMKNNNVEYGLGPIEYSGLTSSSSMVMGVAPFISTINNIITDPILCWKIPKNISLEEAATIPVPYSMAYYILVAISKITKHNSVLVHAGLTSVGQAIIDVCLEKKCQVFATVLDSKQKQQLKQRFPSLPDSNIIVYDEENFEIKFLMTNNKMDVIINCLEGEDFHATRRVLAMHGKFFQLNKNDMKKRYKMGLKPFLQNTSFYAVSMEKIIEESEEMKKCIQNEIAQRLKNNTIIPFDRDVLSGLCTVTQALETLEKFTRQKEFKRLVVSTSKNKNIENIKIHQFQCFPDKIYFIIGNESENWLHLSEWLVQRGALNIVVALEKNSFTPKISRKFNMLMDRYKGITIQLVSQSLLNTEESTRQLLYNSITLYPLAAVFIVNTIDENMIENMQYVVNQISAKYEQKPIFACLLCGGTTPCENLKSTGVNALCFSWGLSFKKLNFTQIIVILDVLLLKSVSLTNATVICSELINQRTKSKVLQTYSDNMFLPSSVDELECISKYIVDEPDFVQITTKSVLYAEAKGAYPIFVLPGFCPNIMTNLYTNLGYPAFVARYPAHFLSIKQIAEILIKKLKKITKLHAVTLVGESWGGSVALVIAQILESEGILVSLSLLNGVPSTLLKWMKTNFIQNKNINVSLLSKYLTINKEMSHNLLSQQEWDTNLNTLLQSNNISSKNVHNTLNMIQTQLNTLLELQPLSNKLHLIPQVFTSRKLSDTNINILNEFCLNPPNIHIVAETTSHNILENVDIIKTINENVAFDYPHTTDKLLDERYSEHYYYNTISLVC